MVDTLSRVMCLLAEKHYFLNQQSDVSTWGRKKAGTINHCWFGRFRWSSACRNCL